MVVCLFGCWFVCLFVCLFACLFAWFVCLVCLLGLFAWFVCFGRAEMCAGKKTEGSRDGRTLRVLEEMEMKMEANPKKISSNRNNKKEGRKEIKGWAGIMTWKGCVTLAWVDDSCTNTASNAGQWTSNKGNKSKNSSTAHGGMCFLGCGGSLGSVLGVALGCCCAFEAASTR